jgi:hypothetical protein
MSRTNAELAEAAPGLLGEEIPSRVDSPEIKVVARQALGRTYVFAVNAGRMHVRARLSVPALDGRPVRVLGEKRSLRAGGHAFADDFPPLGVHRYVQGG